MDQQGTTERDHLLFLANRGNVEAQEALIGPECPSETVYLVEWAFRLFRRSGEGMNGALSLSYQTIDAWARLNDIEIRPWEVDALVLIDDAIRHPEEPKTEDVPKREVPKLVLGWPTRKREPELMPSED